MMGKDCERILTSINTIKDYLSDCIDTLGGMFSKPIEMEEHHIEGDYVNEDLRLKEKEDPVEAGSALASVLSAMDSFMEDCGKLGTLEQNMYAGSTNFNNSYGSPWKEIHNLENAIEGIRSYASGDLKFSIEKISLISKLSKAASCAVDAKWAILFYHDYLQRGFDAKFNNKEPSITYRRANKKATLGNIDQDFDENVNVDRPTYDPF